MTDSPECCLNCEAPMRGPFCAQCGQRDQHRIVPLRHLLRDLFEEFVHVDHHVLKTFWTLLSRPGLLTVDYLEGRRARHLPPLRLYVITSFFLFLALGLGSTHTAKANGGAKRAAATSGDPAKVAPETAPSTPGIAFKRKLVLGGKRAQENPAAFQAQIMGLMPKVLFVLLPVFAALMKLLYLRRRILYAAHVIFALHVHTAAFLMFLATFGLSFIPGLKDWAMLALLFGLPLYLVFALRRAYGQSWPKTLAKGVLLSATYLPLTLLGTLGVVLWALYMAA